MRFIGSKRNLLPTIGQVLQRIPNRNSLRIGDLFSGSGVVSRLFKEMGFNVVANDNLEFCFVLATAVLNVSNEPTFLSIDQDIRLSNSNGLFQTKYDLVLNYLNNLKGKKGFIFNEYSPGGTSGKPFSRQYFSDQNAQKIDAIREKIKEWQDTGKLTQPESCLLISDLLQATNRVANIAGTYGTFIKHWDPRALRPLFLERSKITPGSGIYEVFCEDANELARSVKCDVMYFDPPYTWRHYGAYYHILETITKWDFPEVGGKTGLRTWDASRSRYCDRNDAVNALTELVESANCEHLLLSYNSEGLITHSQILEVLKTRGTPEFDEINYRRYKSNNDGKQAKTVKERIYYVGPR